MLGATGLLVVSGAGPALGAGPRTAGERRAFIAHNVLVPYLRERGFPAGGLGGRLAVAARYLGVSDESLIGELWSGRSLAEIASATPGRSEAGLRAVLIAAARARLDRAVEMGWLTADQQESRLERLGPRIDRLIARQGLPAGEL